MCFFPNYHVGIRLEKVECIVYRVTKMPNERENYVGIVKRGLKGVVAGFFGWTLNRK